MISLPDDGWTAEDIDRAYLEAVRLAEQEEEEKRRLENQTLYSSYVSGPVKALGAGFLESGKSGYTTFADALRLVGAEGASEWASEMSKEAGKEARMLRQSAEEGGTPWLFRAGPETLAQATKYGIFAKVAGAKALLGVGGLAATETYGSKAHEYQQQWLHSPEAKERLSELRERNPSAEAVDLMWEAQIEALPVAAAQGFKTGLITVAGGKAGERAAKWLSGKLGAEVGVVTGAESLGKLSKAAGAKKGTYLAPGATASGGGVRERAATVGLSAGVEALEEASDAAVETALDFASWRPDITGEEVKSRIVDAFLLGGIFGGGLATAFEYKAGSDRKKAKEEAHRQADEDAKLLRPFIDAAYTRVITQRIEDAKDASESGLPKKAPKNWKARAKEAGVKGTNYRKDRRKEHVWQDTVKAEAEGKIKEVGILEEHLIDEFEKRLPAIKEYQEDVRVEETAAFNEVLREMGLIEGDQITIDQTFGLSTARGPAPTFDVEKELKKAEKKKRAPRKAKKRSRAAEDIILEDRMKKGDRHLYPELREEAPVAKKSAISPKKVRDGLERISKGLEKARAKIRTRRRKKIVRKPIAKEHSAYADMASERAKQKGKVREPMTKYRDEGGFAMPIDNIADSIAEKALTTAMKAVNRGKSIADAIDNSYKHFKDKNADTKVTKGEFEQWILPKMLAAQIDLQVNPEDSIEDVAKRSIEKIRRVTEGEVAEHLLASRDGTVATLSHCPKRAIKQIQKFYHGTAQRLLDSDHASLQMIGAEMKNSVDYGDALYGHAQSILIPEAGTGRNFLQRFFDRMSKTERSAAAEFEEFMVAEQDHLMNSKAKIPRELDIDKFKKADGSELSDLAKEMIVRWKDYAKWSGDQMAKYRDANEEPLAVELEGGKTRPFRPIGRLYAPRKLKGKFQEVLENPNDERLSEASIEMAQILKEDGSKKIKDRLAGKETDAELKEELKKIITDGLLNEYANFSSTERVGSESPQRFLALMEKGRQAKKVPVRLLDLSYEGSLRSVAKWAERMGQIQAFGQTVGNRKDIFDTFIDEMEKSRGSSDPETIRYVKKVRDAAYNPAAPFDTTEKVAVGLSKLATPMMLASGMSAIRNMTGMAMTFTLGGRHALKAAVKIATQRFAGKRLAKFALPSGWLTGSDFLNVKSYAESIKDTEEMGGLRRAMGTMLGGHDASIEGGRAWTAIDRKLDTIGEIALQGTAFTPVERFVRIHSAMTFEMYRAAALEAKRKEGENSKLYKEWKRFVKSQGNLSVQALEAENEVTATEDALVRGPETQKYIIRAVKAVQGGYKMDQLPVFMRSPYGKFMLKFYPYGMQIATTFDVNVLRPLKETVGDFHKGDATIGEVGSAMIPLLVALGAATGSGEIMYALREIIFGKKRPHASLGEIALQLEGDNADMAIKSAFNRIVSSFIYAGTMGTLVDTLGTAQDAIQRQRYKDPLDPAPLNIVKSLTYATLRGISEGRITEDNADKFLKETFSTYNYGLGAIKQAGRVLAPEWERARLLEAEQDEYELRRAAERFAEDTGFDLKKPLLLPEWLPTEHSADYNEIERRLKLGDPKGAFDAALVLAESLDPEDRELAAGRISNSIMQRQPLKVGKYSGEETQQEFVNWAYENLPYDVQVRIFRVQSRYINAAFTSGLIGKSDPELRKAVRTVINGKKDTVKKRPRTPRFSDTDAVRKSLTEGRTGRDKTGEGALKEMRKRLWGGTVFGEDR